MIPKTSPSISAVWLLALSFAWLPLSALGGIDKEEKLPPLKDQSPWALDFTKTFPSGVAMQGEAGTYALTVKIRHGEATTATISLTGQVPGEPEEPIESWTLSLAPGETKRIEWPAATEQTGYRVLTAVARDPQGCELGRTVSGLLVLGAPLSEPLPPSESFFGAMFVNDPVVAAKMGLRVDRVAAQWQVIQRKKPGEYDWSQQDAKIQTRLDAGIGIILDVRPTGGGGEVPGGVKWTSCEELAREEHVAEFGEYVRALTERYRDKVLAIEIMNEPDLMCEIKSSGATPAADIYASLLSEAYDAVKSIDPDMPVIGLSISGGDLPELKFSRRVLDLAPGKLDIVGAHPYTSARRIGEDYRPLSPLKMEERERIQAIATMMQDYGLKPRLWSTEFGWAIHKDVDYGSEEARIFGAYTAQALTLARTEPSAEKICWFSFSFPGFEDGCNYGLFRKLNSVYNRNLNEGEWFPVASAAGYATCARLLDDVSFVGEFKLGVMVYGFRFRNEVSGDDVFVLWVDEPHSTGGSARLTLPGGAPMPTLAVDAMGRDIDPSGPLHLEPLPVFLVVSSDAGDAMQQALSAGTLEASEALTLGTPVVTGIDQVSFTIVNNDLQPLPVKVYLQGELDGALSRLIEPGMTDVQIDPRTPLDEPVRTQVVVLNERTGESLSAPLAYSLHPLPRVGSLQELERLAATVPPLVVDQREQVLPPDPTVDWKGADDLSIRAWAGWTDAGIALLLKVKDDVHAGPPPNSGTPWLYDSVQVAFDMGNRATYGYDEACYEYAVSLAEDGSADVLTTAGGLSGVQADVTREGDTTCYALFFPWEAIGARPADAFRMNFIANDNDSGGRQCWMGLTPGIGESKQPDLFHQWVLR